MGAPRCAGAPGTGRTPEGPGLEKPRLPGVAQMSLGSRISRLSEAPYILTVLYETKRQVSAIHGNLRQPTCPKNKQNRALEYICMSACAGYRLLLHIVSRTVAFMHDTFNGDGAVVHEGREPGRNCTRYVTDLHKFQDRPVRLNTTAESHGDRTPACLQCFSLEWHSCHTCYVALARAIPPLPPQQALHVKHKPRPFGPYIEAHPCSIGFRLCSSLTWRRARPCFLLQARPPLPPLQRAEQFGIESVPRCDEAAVKRIVERN